MLKGQTTSSAPTINYCHRFREELVTLTSSSPTKNYYYGLGKRLKTLISSIPTNNYCRGLKKGLEAQTSFTLTNNYCRGCKEELETKLVSTISILFVRSSNILEDALFSIKPIEMGYDFWHKDCWGFGIKKSTPAICSLCK